ncbi:MAG: hypothetical protein RR827_07920, partial [Oscillospiraceae bacterium]
MSNKLTALIDFKPWKISLEQREKNKLFAQEQISFCDEGWEVRLCGCVLNLSQLEKGEKESRGQLIVRLYQQHKEGIVKVLKGEYTLFIQDKGTGEFFLSNDLLSKDGLYYWFGVEGASGVEETLFAGNEFFDLCGRVAHRGSALTVNHTAVAMMMDEGFLWDDVTWAEEIKYLRPFEYIYGDKNGAKVGRLGCGVGDSTLSYSDALKEFDGLFCKAVTLQCEKAAQTGTRQLASLSAGMDSRSTVLTAHRLGYCDIDCFTYAQSGSVDDTVARKIAVDYKLNQLFYPLDGAKFLVEYDRAFPLNEGEQTYCGATGARIVSELLDAENHPIIHTGSLGGELMGDVQFSKTATQAVDKLSGASTSQGLDVPRIKADYERIMGGYTCRQHLEIEKHLRGCQNFAQMVGGKFQAVSPFLDEEVYCFLVGLPFEYKYERKFYVDWMNGYLPNDYITTYAYGKVKSAQLLRKAKYAMRIGVAKLFGKSRYDMNPFDYWGKNYPEMVEQLRAELGRLAQEIRELESGKRIESVAAESAQVAQVAEVAQVGAVTQGTQVAQVSTVTEDSDTVN